MKFQVIEIEAMESTEDDYGVRRMGPMVEMGQPAVVEATAPEAAVYIYAMGGKQASYQIAICSAAQSRMAMIVRFTVEDAQPRWFAARQIG